MNRVNESLLPPSSPHVGTFRHAPSSSLGLKELLWQDDSWTSPFISQFRVHRKVLVSFFTISLLLTTSRMVSSGKIFGSPF